MDLEALHDLYRETSEILNKSSFFDGLVGESRCTAAVMSTNLTTMFTQLKTIVMLTRTCATVQ